MSIETVNEQLGKRESEWIERLKDAVAVRSVSAAPDQRENVVRMAHWVKKELERDWPEAKCWIQETDPVMQQHPSGVSLPLPPLVMAEVQSLGKDGKKAGGGAGAGKKTVLIYAHYDVQPAEVSDGWETDPWVLTLKDGELRGRGSTDDKGPLVGWLNVLRVYRELGKELPVNIKFIFEGMEESGSDGFDSTVRRHAEWFADVDFCCVSDNYWATTKHPCLTYGCRGVTTAEVAVSGPKQDMHSGCFGGNLYEPMDDLVAILGSLKDDSNKILIPDIEKNVLPLSDGELALFQKLRIDLTEQAKDLGIAKFRNQDDKAKCLMSVWRNPSLSIHGIEGAYSEPGFKTVIPRRVVGKFSVRIVPNQKGEDVEAAIRAHVNAVFTKRNSPNQLEIKFMSGPWFYNDPLNSKLYSAAQRATEKIYNAEPDFTREGGSIPILTTLTNLTKSELVLIPMGRCDDRAHAQNEKLDVSNYINGMKLFATFLEELAL